jgi:hypothetical protein
MTFATATGANILGVSEYGESPNPFLMMYLFKFSCHSSSFFERGHFSPENLGIQSKI